MHTVAIAQSGGLGLGARPRLITSALRPLSGGGSIYVPPTVFVPAPHFPPAPTGGLVVRTLSDAASLRHLRLVVDTVNRTLAGKLNVTLAVTLAAGAASTTLTDSRISATSALLFCPLTADAAAEMGAGTLFVQSQTAGSAVIAHANNAQTDRNYTVVILGG
jgi:hypothetical protein